MALTQAQQTELDRLRTDRTWGANEKAWVLALIDELLEDHEAVDLLVELRALLDSAGQVTPPVEPEPLPPLVIEPSDTVTLRAGEVWEFKAYEWVSGDAPMLVAAAWSATGGTIDNTGRYVAGDTTGEYTVTATYEGRSTTVSILLMNSLVGSPTPGGSGEPGEGDFDGAAWLANKPVSGYTELFATWDMTLANKPSQVDMVIVDPPESSESTPEFIASVGGPLFDTSLLYHIHPDNAVGGTFQKVSGYYVVTFPANTRRFYFARALKFSSNWVTDGSGTKSCMCDGATSQNSLYLNINGASSTADPFQTLAFFLAGGEGQDARQDQFIDPASPNPIVKDTWGMWEVEVDVDAGTLKTWANGVAQHPFTDINWHDDDWARLRVNHYHNNGQAPPNRIGDVVGEVTVEHGGLYVMYGT